MPIEHINKTDTLNEGREKINAAIDGANAADVTSKAADTKATQALANSESTQTQLDTIVIDGDSRSYHIKIYRGIMALLELLVPETPSVSLVLLNPLPLSSSIFEAYSRTPVPSTPVVSCNLF